MGIFHYLIREVVPYNPGNLTGSAMSAHPSADQGGNTINVEMKPRQVKAWLATLPSEALPRGLALLQLLAACNRADLADDRRSQLLELLEPPLLETRAALRSQYREAPLPLDEARQARADLAAALLAELAETYRLLEALFPGRIDLGLGRAPGTDVSAALERQLAAKLEERAHQVRGRTVADEVRLQRPGLVDQGHRAQPGPEGRTVEGHADGQAAHRGESTEIDGRELPKVGQLLRLDACRVELFLCGVGQAHRVKGL